MITALFIGYHLFIILIYSGFYIAFENWGSPLTLNVLSAYIDELPHLIESLPFKLSKAHIFSVFTILVLIISIPLIIYRKNIYNGFKSISSHYFTKVQKRLIVFLYMLFPIVFFSVEWLQKKVNQDDPIVSFFLYEFELQYGNKVDEQANYQAMLDYPVNLEFNKKNVILIIVDALRYDHLGYNGYSRNITPFLDSLSRLENTSNLKHFYATSSRSFIGIANILSSKYTIPYQNFFIHDLLKKQGYTINFILGGDHTNFFGLKRYYGNNIDTYFDGYNKQNEDDSQSLNADLALLNRISNFDNFKGNPNFFYFHFMSTHQLGILDAEFRKYQPDKYNLFDQGPDEAILINDYDNRMLQLDHYLKGVINTLEEKGYLDNAIVAITSDHGQSLGERGLLSHSNSVYQAEAKIPLMVIDFSDDTSNKTIASKFNNQLDIGPTILDLLDLPKPDTWQGSSIFKPRTTDYIFLQEKDYYATIWEANDTIYQYIYNNRKREEELFNITDKKTQEADIIMAFDKNQRAKVRNSLSGFYKLKIE